MSNYSQEVDQLLDQLTIPGYLANNREYVVSQISKWRKSIPTTAPIIHNYLQRAEYFALVEEAHHLMCCLTLAWSQLD